ncbi:hypothetical protein GCM10009590_14000 [Brachybacterium alimentarium]
MKSQDRAPGAAQTVRQGQLRTFGACKILRNRTHLLPLLVLESTLQVVEDPLESHAVTVGASLLRRADSPPTGSALARHTRTTRRQERTSPPPHDSSTHLRTPLAL